MKNLKTCLRRAQFRAEKRPQGRGSNATEPSSPMSPGGPPGKVGTGGKLRERRPPGAGLFDDSTTNARSSAKDGIALDETRV